MRRWMLAPLLVSCLSLAGCWDNRPIEGRALVLMIGIEPAPEGQLSVHFQVPTSSVLSALASNSGSTQGSPNYVVQGTGPNVAAAFAEAQGKVGNDLYLGQTQMVLLSSQLSAVQFRRAIDFLVRTGPLDKTAFVATTPEPVREVLLHQPPEQQQPALYLTSLFSCPGCAEVNLARLVFNLERRSSTPGVDIWLPVLRTTKSNYLINEVAIYHAGLPVLTLDAARTPYFGYLTGLVSKAVLTVDTPFGPVGIRALRSATQIRAIPSGSHLELRADLSLTGTLDSLPPGDATAQNLHFVEELASRRILAEELSLLTELQRLGADPAGLMERCLWRHPEWIPRQQEIYRAADIRVTVRTRITDVGDAL